MKFLIFFIAQFVSWVVFAQQPAYQVVEDVRITMRDGVRLAGHLSYPDTKERVPVILIFTPYARQTDLQKNTFVFQFATKLGYAYAQFYTRGSGSSEGESEPFEHDVNDVYDLIDWLGMQPWCNGEVAMGGASYAGYTQWAALKNPHPALKTIVPMVAAAPGKDLPTLNGVAGNYMLRWLSLFDGKYCNDESFHDTVYWKNIYNQHYKLGLASAKLDSLAGRHEVSYQRWLSHPLFDAYWRSRLPATNEEFSRIDIPVLTVTGFFDSDQRGAMFYYNMHQRSKKENRHYLLIGPYDHWTGQNTKHLDHYGYYKFDSTAYINKMMLGAMWYNHVLKKAPLPPQVKDKVNVFVIGNGWRHAHSLAAMAPDSMKFFVNRRTLSDKPSRPSASALGFNSHSINDTLLANYTYRNALPFNHADEFPLPSTGSETYVQQAPMLILDSPPLRRTFDLIGSPVAMLYLSASGIADADLELSYYELTPDGRSLPLSHISQRLSLVDDSTRQLLREGEIRKFVLDNSYLMGKRITKGSRIRITVRIINEAALQKNYGSGKDVHLETFRDARKGSLTVHGGAANASLIYLPGAYVR